MQMGNGEKAGKTIVDWLRDIIQFGLIPLLYLGYTQVSGEITKNAELLRQVQTNQVRVMSTVSGIQADLTEHEMRQAHESIERGRVHHTTQRSCLECKIPGRENYPLQQGKESLFKDR